MQIITDEEEDKANKEKKTEEKREDKSMKKI
jgi:hypothetical protein